MAGLVAGCAPAPPKVLKGQAQHTAYRIGPGDQLQIFVRNNPDLSVTVPVRPDGKISIPLVQSIRASNKTPTELSKDLERSLSTYVRDPRVTVIVTEFHGTYADQVRVVGEAARPQSMPYRTGMTLLDVMINVGGLTQFAAGNRATLVRHVNGQTRKYSVNIEDLLSGNINDNVPMRPGDVVIIPRTFF
ncbi:XrtA/PEP-CTERM system exopolysaccharide export protein [Salinisphaera sp.]|uniref:XrtA/PEP-CTERM system exopolysaccharide export protein n=1 Tax=Salinisphaera sp. TaxID=1914330 RepID=UPI002D76A89A|nr:XrtA/PEP-CTERM system exopolysaccharide export protein [Salinisphaera sp.]HET7314052.1 XrtA/PEP-CTERM system exopolysaccharide export protein [Salinisphaera sp.]